MSTDASAQATTAQVSALTAAGLARSLQRLFLDNGTTPEAVAAAMPFYVDPALFYRVDSQRQPLPADVAKAVAVVLGVDLGTVRGAARLVTAVVGEYVRRPLPPDPLAFPNPISGETYTPPRLTPYAGVIPSASGALLLWTFGGGGGGG